MIPKYWQRNDTKKLMPLFWGVNPTKRVSLGTLLIEAGWLVTNATFWWVHPTKRASCSKCHSIYSYTKKWDHVAMHYFIDSPAWKTNDMWFSLNYNVLRLVVPVSYFKYFRLLDDVANQKLSKPQLNHNSTQPNITLSWVRHENDFAYHPTPHPPPTQTQC